MNRLYLMPSEGMITSDLKLYTAEAIQKAIESTKGKVLPLYYTKWNEFGRLEKHLIGRCSEFYEDDADIYTDIISMEEGYEELILSDEGFVSGKMVMNKNKIVSDIKVESVYVIK